MRKQFCKNKTLSRNIIQVRFSPNLRFNSCCGTLSYSLTHLIKLTFNYSLICVAAFHIFLLLLLFIHQYSLYTIRTSHATPAFIAKTQLSTLYTVHIWVRIVYKIVCVCVQRYTLMMMIIYSKYASRAFCRVVVVVLTLRRRIIFPSVSQDPSTLKRRRENKNMPSLIFLQRKR